MDSTQTNTQSSSLFARMLRYGGTFGYFTATSTFALAIVSGFLVSGAPAGLGIREAVFIAVAPTDFRFAATTVIALLQVTQMVADLLTPSVLQYTPKGIFKDGLLRPQFIM